MSTTTNPKEKHAMIATLFLLAGSILMVAAQVQQSEAQTGKPGAASNIILVSQELEEGNNSTSIVGEITNNGTEPAESVQLTVSFYDSVGGIIETDFAYVEPNRIEAGATAPFNVTLALDKVAAKEVIAYSIQAAWRDPKVGDTSQEILPKEPLGK
jgi:hypothetical protein